MRRLHLGVLAAALPLAALSLALVGCGGKPTDDEGPRRSRSRNREKGQASKPLTPVPNTGYTGVLRGKIKWVGAKPDFAALNAQQQADARGKQDGAHCAIGNSVQHTYFIGDNDNVGNVFVWIRPPDGTYFQIPEAKLKELFKPEVPLDQPNCVFTPHCVALFPQYRPEGKDLVHTGQKLVVLNTDSVDHNTNLAETPRNPAQNVTVPKKTGRKEFTLTPDEK
jgi:hypothetical protein